MAGEPKRIGEILIENGEITEKQLNQALEIQRKSGGLLGVILVKAGHIDQGVMARYLARQTADTISRYRKEKAAG